MTAPSIQTLKILTYNLWALDEDVAERMAAVGSVVLEHMPDFIAFQEVTKEMEVQLLSQEWVKAGGYARGGHAFMDEDGPLSSYWCILLSRFPTAFTQEVFVKTSMGRGLYQGLVDLSHVSAPPLRIATTHLESTSDYKKTRREQRNHLFDSLSSVKEDVILMGDFNHVEKTDGVLEYDEQVWEDAWMVIPGNTAATGYTFDSVTNKNISFGFFRSRLDRVFVKSSTWRTWEVELVGTGDVESLGAPPSDHYGVLVTVRRCGET